MEQRLKHHGLRSDTLDLLDTASLQAAADQIAQQLRACEQPPILVAHGIAVPAALRAASLAPPRALVLTNGPTTALDPVLRALAQIPTAALTQLMRPRLWLRWLSSSAGLRRAVINPYVMDRDTVVAVCHDAVSTAQRRSTLAALLKDLSGTDFSELGYDGPALVVWGDQDPLYPLATVDSLRKRLGQMSLASIPGGQHLHPIERPWALADAVAEWVARPTP